MLRVVGQWVHADDKISVNCSVCFNLERAFSKSTDAALVGLEYQRCVKTALNGGTLSLEHKAGFIFYDDSEGWDLQTGLRYTIPLNCGRWGYLKGGYRFIQIKRSQPDPYPGGGLTIKVSKTGLRGCAKCDEIAIREPLITIFYSSYLTGQ